MIDVRELRIGNYVYLFRGTAPSKITDIGYSEIEEDRYEAGGISSESVFRTYVDNLNPIPLTAELLLKCGFQLINKATDEICSNVFCLHTNYDVTFEGAGGIVMVLSHGNYLCDNITELHKLQNLYFAIIGKELEVSL